MSDIPVPAPLRRCSSECGWARRPGHDELLRLETDASVLPRVIRVLIGWHEADDYRQGVIPPHDLAGFVTDHNWSDPGQVSGLVADLDFLRSLLARHARDLQSAL